MTLQIQLHTHTCMHTYCGGTMHMHLSKCVSARMQGLHNAKVPPAPPSLPPEISLPHCHPTAGPLPPAPSSLCYHSVLQSDPCFPLPCPLPPSAPPLAAVVPLRCRSQPHLQTGNAAFPLSYDHC